MFPGSAAEYTCPMHPEIVRQQPGECPICGMALEPREIDLEAANPELDRHDPAPLDQRGTLGPVAAAHVLDAAAREHSRRVDRWRNWVELALATPVVLWCGWPFFVRGWRSVVTARLNMFTLIALGTGAAYLYSVVATVAPGLFPQSVRAREERSPSTSNPRR